MWWGESYLLRVDTGVEMKFLGSIYSFAAEIIWARWVGCGGGGEGGQAEDETKSEATNT